MGIVNLLYGLFKVYLLFEMDLLAASQVCKYKEGEYASATYKFDYTQFVSNAFVAFWNEEVGFTYCDAVAIGRKHALTTAQCLTNTKCVRDLETRKFECFAAKASEYDIVMQRPHMICSDEPAEFRTGKEIFIHPNYLNSHDLTYGVGLIEAHFIDGDEPLGGIHYNYHPTQKASFYSEDLDKCFLLFYAQSSCTNVFTKLVRANRYTFNSGEKFQHIQLLNLTKVDNKKECDDVYNKYAEAGIVYNKSVMFCLKAKFTSDDDCQYFPGARVLCGPIGNEETVGITLQSSTCRYAKQPLLFLRMDVLNNWISSITTW